MIKHRRKLLSTIYTEKHLLVLPLAQHVIKVFMTVMQTQHTFSLPNLLPKKILKEVLRPEKMSFYLTNASRVIMEKRNDSFYQVAILKDGNTVGRSIDIVIGSGTKGQTYLNWMGNRLSPATNILFYCRTSVD